MRAGYKERFGDHEEKKRIALEEYHRQIKENPEIKRTVAHQRAATAAGVSVRTVIRYLNSRSS